MSVQRAGALLWRTRPAQRLSGCTHARPGALLALLIRLGSRSTPAPLCTCPSLPRPPHGLPFVCGATGTFSGPAPPACTIAIPVRFQWPEAHERPSRRHLSAPASLPLPFPQLAFDSSHPAPPIGQLCNLHFVRSAARGCAARCGGPALPAAYPLSPLNCHRALSTTPASEPSNQSSDQAPKKMARLAALCSRCSPVCSLQQRERSDQHRPQQRGGPAGAARRSTFPGLREAFESAPTSASEQQQQGAQIGPLGPAALAAAGFAAVAADVFSPGSLHVLLSLDQWAHAAVSGAHWDPALQRLLAGKSNRHIPEGDPWLCSDLRDRRIDSCAASAPPQPCSEDQHLPPTCRQAGQRRGHRCGAGGLGGSGRRRAAAHPTCLAAPAPHAGHLSSGVPAGGRQHQARRYTVGGGHEGRLAPCAPLGSAPHLCFPQVCWLCVPLG